MPDGSVFEDAGFTLPNERCGCRSARRWFVVRGCWLYPSLRQTNGRCVRSVALGCIDRGELFVSVCGLAYDVGF
jgi:hypothetical protein